MASVSVIIPALNAAATLKDVVAHIRDGDCDLVQEIIVSDGGSEDGTPDCAAQLGCVLIGGVPGRGRSLVRGAETATGRWLLFVHADTRLSPNWGKQVSAFIGENSGRDCAAVFKLKLDDTSAKARLLETVVAFRVWLFSLPYGDQGLLISRDFYDKIGGYAPIPLMEDVDIVRRIGRRRLRLLSVTAETSAIRYRREGYMRRSGRNALCLTLYALGVSPAWLAKFYVK